MPGVTTIRRSSTPARSTFASSPEDTTPGATRGERPAGAGEHQLFDVALEAEVVEIAAIQARQHGDREDAEAVRGADRRFHDRLVAVHGREGHAAVSRFRTAPATVAGTSKSLRSRKIFLPRPASPVEQLEGAARHEQLEAELVERHGVAEPVRERARRIHGRHVHREDQALARRVWRLWSQQPPAGSC